MVKSLLLLTLLATLLGAFCAKKSKVCRDQVLLQVSNGASSLTSATALRLRRRLAADPSVVDRAAAALGVELKPIQRKLVSQLKAAGASNHTEHLSLMQRAEEDGAALMDQMASLIANELANGDVQTARTELFNGIATATTTIFDEYESTGISVDPGTVVSTVGGVMGAMAGMVNPIAGAVFTMGAAILGGILSSNSLSEAMIDLYEQIMKEVKELVTNKMNEAQAREFRVEAALLIHEMKFATTLFKHQNNSQAAAGFEDQMNLVWLLIFQHDLRVLRYQLLGAAVCYPNAYPAKEDCWNWHKQCTFLQVFEVINAERGAAVDAFQLEPHWGLEMEKRIRREIPDDVIGVLGEGQWACMDGIQDGWFQGPALENSTTVYRAAWEKFPALLNLSTKPHHKAYAEYARTRPGDSSSEAKMMEVGIDGNYACLDEDDRLCGEPRGLLQGVYMPNGGCCASKMENLAYHYFNINEGAEYDATYSHTSTNGCNDGDFVTEVQSQLNHWRVGMKCNQPKEAAAFSGGSHGGCFALESIYHWKGCPAGMFIRKVAVSSTSAGTMDIECCPMVEPKQLTPPSTTTVSTSTTTTTRSTTPTTSMTIPPWGPTTTTPPFFW